MHENTTEIFIVFLDPVVELFYYRLIQKTQNTFFELSAPFAGDDLNQRNPLAYSLVHDTAKLGIDRLPFVENIV